jgi:hypothetical protein
MRRLVERGSFLFVATLVLTRCMLFCKISAVEWILRKQTKKKVCQTPDGKAEALN